MRILGTNLAMFRGFAAPATIGALIGTQSKERLMSIDTARVQNRRQPHFDKLEDILADVEQLNRGNIKSLGNWSSGQILHHVSTVMNQSIDGSPIQFSLILRIFGKIMKARVLNKGMPPGFQLKGRAAEILVPRATTWESGLAEIRHAIHRLQSEPNRAPSPFLGAMTREEWDKLHCRHCELHLSFLVPQDN